MALTVHETHESRTVSEANGKASGTRKFLVYDDASEITHPGPLRDLFGSSGLPDVGDQFPNSPALYAVSYSIRHVPAQRGLWEVEYQYESTEPGRYQPQEVGYTEFSIEYSAELRDMWRAPPGLNFPTNGSPGSTNRLCNGRSIDVAGVPMSVLHRFSTLTITETVASTTVSDRSQKIRAARGKRNALEFYGAPVGQVLYVGATASRIALDKFQIVHRFAQDAHYHMIQTPERGPSGQVAKLERDSSGVLRAADVFWVQPFDDFIDMNSISENF